MFFLRNKGFTLVEVVVACLVAVVCFTGVFHIFKQSRSSIVSTDEKMSLLHQGRMLLEYIKRDLRCVYSDPLDKDTEIIVNKNEIKFSRVIGNTAGTPILSRMHYKLNKETGIIERDDEKGIDNRFGNDNVRMKTFDIKKITTKIGSKLNVYFQIKIIISSNKSGDRSNLELNEKIFPPLLQTAYGQKWVK